ncbi:dolichyl-phosphate-mannose--protein mannosyltransferase [Kitasatospora purpeofusca]|uniref:dolichyl-phosphate-mannose--protein mannosyltransferase n=1 Tax=Kitasatospora purpeofusca TaxID=67352 RepID=UPI0022596C37|nr:phospholipid carrier-dependent glycosyltransferase [Kitasatospora purpeofusca]MCX4752585.1 phospholipid carrier-dependent glycosyltransferase [Kitasatospora purpeofusca]WSR32153.1 phospholipid carrier-dependent glycosyltransferase [Kitasatospora purpeofusca]
MTQAALTHPPAATEPAGPAPERRGLPRLAAARWDWLGPIAVAVFAGLLRFWNLGHPNAFVFDETYYPKDAWSLLRQGYEGTWPEHANEQILAVPQQIPLTSAPEFIAHPPLGKWVISLGEWGFGLHPFGWRFMTALLGTVTVLMLARIGRRLFGSTLIGCTAALLMAVDGLQLVMSRVGLLDGVQMFFVLAAFGALLIDRDRTRARLAAVLPDRGGDTVRLGCRPWRIAAGACLGAAAGVKWNGVMVLAAFGVLTVLWDRSGRRWAGARRPWRSMLRRDAGPAFLATVGTAFVVYVAGWAGWLFTGGGKGATGGGFDRHWTDDRAGLSPDSFLGVPLPQLPMDWVPAPLRSLWHYHAQMYDFNTGLSSPHTYQSNPFSWLVQGRPVSMYWEQVPAGQHGCTASGGCAAQILGLGTPLLWWTACFALVYLLWRWAFRRDWRSGAVLCAVAGVYLPWFQYQERTVFSFYMVVLVPFLCLAVAQMLGAMLGPEGCSPERRRIGAAGAGLVVLAIMACFAFFYPLYTAEVIPMTSWQDRMWFTTWI